MPYLVAAGYQGKCVFNDLIEMNAPLNIACLYPRRLLEATKDIDSYKIICDKDDEIGKFLENNPTIFL